MFVSETNGLLGGVNRIEARQIGAVAETLRATGPTKRPGPRVDLVLSISASDDPDEIEIEFEIDLDEE